MFPEHHFFPWLMSARIWPCYCNGKVVINFAKLRRLIIHLSSISLSSMPISDPAKCWLHDWCCHWLSSCVSRQVSEQVGTSLIRIFSVQMCALNFKIKIFFVSSVVPNKVLKCKHLLDNQTLTAPPQPKGRNQQTVVKNNQAQALRVQSMKMKSRYDWRINWPNLNMLFS